MASSDQTLLNSLIAKQAGYDALSKAVADQIVIIKDLVDNDSDYSSSALTRKRNAATAVL
jgi:hypothetical protein|tara:strand:+ start:85 stop:264 length:180 start_codon:yes stop_codon:yes gene_type:complete